MNEHHAIDYIEIKVKNVGDAKRFYTEAFGWKFNDYGTAYAGIQGAGKEVGGLAESDEVSPGGPFVVLYSDDLDASLSAVRHRMVVFPLPALPTTAKHRVFTRSIDSSTAATSLEASVLRRPSMTDGRNA